MAMNSSVAAGRMVQMTSRLWLPCVYLTGSAFVLRVVSPQEPEQQQLGGDEHQPGQHQDEIEQVIDLLAVLWKCLAAASSRCTAPTRTRPTPEDGHQQKQQAPEPTHDRSSTSALVRLCVAADA